MAGENCMVRSVLTCASCQTLPDYQLRRKRWVGHVAQQEGTRYVIAVSVRNPEGKRQLG